MSKPWSLETVNTLSYKAKGLCKYNQGYKPRGGDSNLDYPDGPNLINESSTTSNISQL